MSSGFSRTIAVGVGRAGIDVLSALAAGDGFGWGQMYDNRFEYVAVAANPSMLQQAPEGALEVRLPVTSDTTGDARSGYPYRLPTHGNEEESVGRHRSVGRSAFDVPDTDTQARLEDAIERVFNTLLAEDDNNQLRSCNVVHLYAMDAGLGSGTFPLVAYSINEITDKLRKRYGVSIYNAGIGIVPKLSHGIGHGFEYVVPTEERWRYANTYAALRDLEKLTQANPDNPLPVHFHAERNYDNNQRFILGDTDPDDYIDAPPYRHHFLIDDGGDSREDAVSPEGAFTRRISEAVASVYGLAALGSETQSWLPPPVGPAHFSSFGQAQLSLPIEDIRTYCHLQERIEELEKTTDATDDRGRLTDESTRRSSEIETELDSLRTELERVVERLTTPHYGPRCGRLALDEQIVRRNLDRETLQTELTSLSAFHNAGYLLNDLRTVMESRIPLASAWQSRLLTWSEESAAGTAGGHYSGRREIWMLHSDENDSLPAVDRLGAGQHTFRRSSGGQFPPFSDPYTIQFLTYCVEAPLSELRMYAELDGATGVKLDALLEEWDDSRQAFAYPEWYGRDVRRYFDIRTRVELPRPPELDLGSVYIERTGKELLTWLSSHGLASYLWLADEWDRYQGYITTHGSDTVGWRAGLRPHGLTYQDMRSVVPNGAPVAQWFSGEVSWDRLLSQVVTELGEQEGLSVAFTDKFE